MAINKTQVIVIGAGPAGVSAAITIARAGKNVLLIERGDKAGDKNMFGGEIYTEHTLEVFPNFIEEAPLEKPITEQKIIMLNNDNSIEFSYKENFKNYADSYSTVRAKWDNWCVEQAIKEGVIFAPKTLVKELLIEDSKVVGIQTELEKYYADIVIVADGVNSLLLEQIGLRKKIQDSDVTVNVKEVIKLPAETIQNRFNVDEKSGQSTKILGGPFKNLFAIGFMFTNKETISIGMGISLDDLKKIELKPYELLDKLKEHPSINPYIKGGQTIEYSAHLIPEGGYKSMPKLYTNGLMAVGDSAMLVNNIHFEGTNLAVISGKLAGETAIEALNKNDFSSKQLSLYEKKLKQSFILKDLKTHKNTIEFIKKNINTITDIYPELGCGLFKVLTHSSKEPKNEVYRKFLFKVLKSGAILKTIPLVLFAMEKCFKR